MADVRKIPIDLIRADAKAQPRQHISTDVVASYSDDMATGAVFPPLVVFKEGNTFWLADGFHRLAAARGTTAKIACDVRHGGLRDAVLYSCGANAEHGYRRTNEDKRRAVLKLLGDPEWVVWSDSEIARRAHVHHTFVGKLRGERASLETNSSEPERNFRTRHGTETTMRTAAIGPRKQPSFDEQAEKKDGSTEPVRYNEKETEIGWIVPVIWSVLESIKSLPPAERAAVGFPRKQRATVDADQIEAAGRWLVALAKAARGYW